MEKYTSGLERCQFFTNISKDSIQFQLQSSWPFFVKIDRIIYKIIGNSKDLE